MAFKVNVKGRDDESGYDLSYGKGGNKLVAFAAKQPDGRFVCPEVGSESMKLREIKEAFGVWAVANYQGEVEGAPAASRPPVSRPPSFRQAPLADTPTLDQYTEGERDPICQGEADFFLQLSKLRRKLTDVESRQLRDITNYLTGLRGPVKVERPTDAGEHVHAGSEPEDTDGGDRVGQAPVADDEGAGVGSDEPQAAPVASGPPPFRPPVRPPVAGPPRYNKPPSA